ncbi:MAG: hypothetical protein JWM98_2783 [Thermoleophilia bacterium]|nr:hypothetical protein [Thermoleophilia bacterium]
MSSSFASSSWAELLGEQLRDSATVRTECVTWIFGPIAFVVDADEEHGVEPTTLLLDLHEGTVRGVSAVPSAESGRVPFAIGGSLARWKAVFGGTQGIVDGVLDSRLRVRGDLPTLMRHRALLDAVAAAGASVETSWQDETEAAATA